MKRREEEKKKRREEGKRRGERRRNTTGTYLPPVNCDSKRRKAEFLGLTLQPTQYNMMF